MGLHVAIGLLTDGVEGAVGAGTGAAVVPVVGEVIADLNLPDRCARQPHRWQVSGGRGKVLILK